VQGTRDGDGQREEEKPGCDDPHAVKEPREGRNDVAAFWREPATTMFPRQKTGLWDPTLILPSEL
jgi:hypothetical protein